MSTVLNPASDFDESLVYQIRLKGHLDDEWSEWFGGLSITLEADGTTLLTSPAIDQAALHGLLKKVRNLGLPLISVNCLDPDHIDGAEIAPGNSSISSAQGEN